MPSYNKVLLMGNLTRDPALKFLPNQTPCTEFGIACNRKFKTQSGEEREDVTFVDCTSFGRTAEVINQYFTKGKPIFIEGRLKYDTWDDKQGGGRRSKLSVHVDTFQFVGGDRPAGSGNDGGDDGGGYVDDGQPQQQQRPQSQQRQQQQLAARQQAQPQQQRQPQRQQQTRQTSIAQDSRDRSRAAAPTEAPFPDSEGFTDADIPF